MSKKTIVSTVGTSIFEKIDKDEIICEELLEKLDLKISENQNKLPECFENSVKDLLENLNEENSAEIKSIEAIKKKEDLKDDYNIVFFSSDTIESYLVAKSLEEYYKKQGIEACIRCIKNLRIDNLKEFNNGIIKLFEELENLINNKNSFQTNRCKLSSKTEKENFIFNITGGYKAVVPFITLFATLYNLPVYYIFEDSDELIKLKVPPISFDDRIADLYLPFLDKNGLKLLEKEEFTNIKNELIQLGLIRKNKNIEKTAIGNLFFNLMQHRKTSLGLVIEYVVMEKFLKEGFNFIEKSVNYTVADAKEDEDKRGEIDLIFEKDNKVFFIEVKSFGNIDKSQLEKHILKFISSYPSDKEKILKLVIYLIDKELLNNKKKLFEEISNFAKKEGIKFEVSYIEIQPSDNFILFIDSLKNKSLENFKFKEA